MRWLYESLCSISFSAVIVWTNEQNGASTFLGILARPLYGYLFPAIRRIYRADFRPGGFADFIAMSLFLGLIILLLLRVLNYASPIRPIALVSTGLLNILSFPVGYLLAVGFWKFSYLGKVLLALEMLGIAVVTLLLYVKRPRHVPLKIAILGLAAHFGVWAWATASLSEHVNAVQSYGLWNPGLWAGTLSAILLPSLSFFASAAWALYIRSRQEPQASTIEVNQTGEA